MLTAFWGLAGIAEINQKCFHSFTTDFSCKCEEFKKCVAKILLTPPFLLPKFCKHTGRVACLWEVGLALFVAKSSARDGDLGEQRWPLGMWKRHHLPLQVSSDLCATKTTDLVGSLWVSASKAADRVNTKEINVSIHWATLSLVNTHNRFAGFIFSNTSSWPCNTVLDKMCPRAAGSVGLWPSHICNMSLLTHPHVLPRGQRSCRES